MEANSKVIEAGEKQGVRTYIYVPCIVYGEGAGFGNRISIQTVAIVRAAKALRRVCEVDDENGVSSSGLWKQDDGTDVLSSHGPYVTFTTP